MNKINRLILIIILSLVLIIMSVELYFLYKPVAPPIEHKVEFIIGEIKPISVNEKYTEMNVKVLVDNQERNELIMLDLSKFDTTKVGKSNVTYYILYDNMRYEKVVSVDILDTEAPKITLTGKNITLLIGEKYTEPGYTISDNYDKDLESKIIIKNDIDTSKTGKYEIKYTVTDSSGNTGEASRTVTVKKPNVVVATPPKEVKVETPKVVETSYDNTIKKNKFTSNSISIDGYLKNPLEENKLILKGDNEKEYNLTITNNNYSLSINPEEISNGTYKIYINEEPLLNKMAIIERLVRAKVGSKLVTFTYDSNDEVTVNITDHAYAYDILINPGHGGSDTGAVNEYIAEKEMNLIVSMYEKCRYEAHGLNVYMTRTSDVYNNKDFGPGSLIRLHKVAYEMGYYGAVSKIVYSNHHNSIGNNYYSGYEILVGGSLTSSQLSPELSIAGKLNNIMPITENHTRFYARDYDTERIYSKLNGETYTFKDNYAVNRIPLSIFNVKSIIYEGCYMSNKKDFNWYWQEGNWYEVSEAKIETYVTSLGINYNSDNSSCIG